MTPPVRRTPTSERPIRISSQIAADQARALEDEARINGRSLAGEIRMMVAAYLRERGRL